MRGTARELSTARAGRIWGNSPKDSVALTLIWVPTPKKSVSASSER